MKNNTYVPYFLSYNKDLKTRARKMRNNPTDAEKRMWDLLRSGKLNSVRFLRQKIIGNYIADFYCASQKIIIEVDGSGHNSDETKEYDKIRTQFFNNLGIKVVRFWNTDVLTNPEGVYEKILEEIDK
ncbi:hypothetical protein CSB37_02350 [bacterium DOLZORAL124_38_8]|nr:MAG: hypothetical protein CSB37_02350 [bacterium DOLZORAL124_38_8]